MQHDVIIIGAGSAGCVLASRLTEDPDRSVLLLEAGPDYPEFEHLPDHLKNGDAGMRSAFSPHNWGYVGKANEHQSRWMPKPRGRVVGGTSAINGGVVARGAPEDYDQWASWGNDEWSFAKVLPYFCKLETDMDFGGDFHGSSGPLPVRRYKREEWLPMVEAFYQACLAEGFAYDPDQNQPVSTGVGPAPRNILKGVRMSTALAFLAPARHRSNLTVRGNATVRRILFEGKQAAGVEFESEGQLRTEKGSQIILSSGAIGSPQILMLSGVGPEAHLRSLGIPVVCDLPGVGENLRDHPFVLNLFRARGLHTDPLAPLVQMGLRYTVPGSDTRNDMILEPLRMPTGFIRNYFKAILSSPWRYIHDYGLTTSMRLTLRAAMGGPPYFGIGVALRKPLNVGQVRLTSADPHVQPSLMYRYLADPWDRQRMRHGVRLAFSLSQRPPLRDMVLSTVLPTRAQVADDQKLDKWLLSAVSTQHHDAGTCKMGPESDSMAVVDQHCRVRGVKGLRVADCSVMPDVIRANTSVPAMMIAERVADWVKEDR